MGCDFSNSQKAFWRNLSSKENFLMESSRRCSRQERHSSGEGECWAGAGGKVLCSGSSPGPGREGCGAVGREQCIDGKHTEWTLVNPRFFTSASLLQIQLTFLKAPRVLPLHAEEENKEAGKQQNTDKDYLKVSPNF